ncbi:MAG: hypothetical protein HQK91_14215, partial [Nitrospirae bacterium]|nr:hypothetical protein [Nitrospirota bacterium]
MTNNLTQKDASVNGNNINIELPEIDVTVVNVDKLNDSFKGLNEAFDKLIDSTNEYIKISLDIAAGFIDTARNAENYISRLTSIVGDKTEATKIYKEFKEIADHTTLQIPDMIKTYQSMYEKGLNPTSDMVKNINGAAMAGSHDSKWIEKVIEILNKILKKGVTSNDLKKLEDMGIPALDYINKNLNKKFTKPEDIDKEENKISPADAVKAVQAGMKEKSDNFIKDTKENWDTLMDHLNKSWESFKEKIMDGGAFKTLEKNLQELSDFVDKLVNDSSIKELGKIFGEVIEDISVSVNTLIKTVNFGKTLGKLISTPFILELNLVKAELKAVLEYFTGMFIAGLETKFGDFLQFITDKMDKIHEKLISLQNRMLHWIGNKIIGKDDTTTTPPETKASGGLAQQGDIVGGGEFVMTRAATKNWGTDILNSLNNFQMPALPKMPELTEL